MSALRLRVNSSRELRQPNVMLSPFREKYSIEKNTGREETCIKDGCRGMAAQEAGAAGRQDCAWGARGGRRSRKKKKKSLEYGEEQWRVKGLDKIQATGVEETKREKEERMQGTGEGEVSLIMRVQAIQGSGGRRRK